MNAVMKKRVKARLIELTQRMMGMQEEYVRLDIESKRLVAEVAEARVRLERVEASKCRLDYEIAKANDETNKLTRK